MSGARDHKKDAREALIRLAVEVSACAPVRPSRYAGTAYIPWRIVNLIRTALTAAGLDWRRVALETQAPHNATAMLGLERGAKRGEAGYADALARARADTAAYKARREAWCRGGAS